MLPSPLKTDIEHALNSEIAIAFSALITIVAGPPNAASPGIRVDPSLETRTTATLTSGIAISVTRKPNGRSSKSAKANTRMAPRPVSG